jgi:hypothetical protein
MLLKNLSMETKIGSNKSFGIVFGIFFLIIFLWLLVKNGSLNYWFLSISIVFFILGFINSKILSPLNYIWAKFGVLLGKIISPLIMMIIFFGVVTPIGLLIKLLKKDLLSLKKNNDKTYWINKDDKVQSKMKNQY